MHEGSGGSPCSALAPCHNTESGAAKKSRQAASRQAGGFQLSGLKDRDQLALLPIRFPIPFFIAMMI
jgi:hypothetical protein